MSAPGFRVRFYLPAARGQKPGIRTQYFTDRAEAEAFASTQKLYAKPATVAIVEPLTDEQQIIANHAFFGTKAAS